MSRHACTWPWVSRWGRPALRAALYSPSLSLSRNARAQRFVRERGHPRAKDRRLCPLTNPRNACIDRFWSYLGRPGVPDSPKGRCASTKMAVASINQSHSLQSLWLPSPFGPRSPCVSALFGQCSVGKGSPLPLFLLEPEDRESHATREKHPVLLMLL